MDNKHAYIRHEYRRCRQCGNNTAGRDVPLHVSTSTQNKNAARCYCTLDLLSGIVHITGENAAARCHRTIGNATGQLRRVDMMVSNLKSRPHHCTQQAGLLRPGPGCSGQTHDNERQQMKAGRNLHLQDQGMQQVDTGSICQQAESAVVTAMNDASPGMCLVRQPTIRDIAEVKQKSLLLLSSIRKNSTDQPLKQCMQQMQAITTMDGTLGNELAVVQCQTTLQNSHLEAHNLPL